jgi:hypothetical protein
MPDNSVECVLGRLLESVENIKTELNELKEDHKSIKQFIDDQKSFYKYVWMFVGFLGSIIYFGRDLYDFVYRTKVH